MTNCRAFVCILAGIILLGALAPMVGSSAAVGPSPVPTPVVTNVPTTAGTRGFPFPNTGLNLASLGYVQEELFLSGTARSYVPVAPLAGSQDGRWDATPTGPTAAYKIRLLIRRPIDPAKFNGTVLFEWLNVSGGRDADSFDSYGAQFQKDGYVYVGVSAQANGLNHLPKWDPARYGSLVHPGDSYSYDIYSQAAQAVRRGNPAPLANLTSRIKYLIAWGGSQSGARLITYYNAVHPTARVIDGFVPYITANGANLTQATLPVVAVPAGAQSKIRTDLRTPLLFQNSESEFINSGRGLHTQPDSAWFRMWEHAGTTHASNYRRADSVKRMEANGITGGGAPNCGALGVNDMNVFPIWRAMLSSMRDWLRTGRPPSIAPRVELVVPADPMAPVTIVRDPATGIAKGGIRLPDVAVPTRTYSGVRPAGAPAGCTPLYGSVDVWNGDSDPYDKDKAIDISPQPEPVVAQLYKDNATYVKAVKKTADGLAAKGFISRSDAAEMVETAKTVKIR